jgi:hypothetical protein
MKVIEFLNIIDHNNSDDIDFVFHHKNGDEIKDAVIGSSISDDVLNRNIEKVIIDAKYIGTAIIKIYVEDN